MRSRTELVTTTFDLDSDEDDLSPDDDDDSEEDWRPNMRPQQKQQRATGSSTSSGGGGGGSSGEAAVGRKRKGNTLTITKIKRRLFPTKLSDIDFDSDDCDDDCDLDTEFSDEDFDVQPTPSTSSSSSMKRLQSLPPKKQFNKQSQLDLLLKKRDIMAKDWTKNSRLCLWRKDEQTQLLHKYLRVKTSQDADRPHEQAMIFTSTAVYAPCDDEDIDDFIDVKVTCLDPNNRRIQLVEIEAIKKKAKEIQATAEEEKGDTDEKGKKNKSAAKKEEPKKIFGEVKVDKKKEKLEENKDDDKKKAKQQVAPVN